MSVSFSSFPHLLSKAREIFQNIDYYLTFQMKTKLKMDTSLLLMNLKVKGLNSSH